MGERVVGLKVADARCAECLFSRNKIVDDARRDAVLRQCERTDTYFECHKGTLRGDEVVCAGFYESFRRGERTAQGLRLARTLDLVVLVDPVTGVPRRRDGGR